MDHRYLKRHHVYILICRGGYLYTGYTTNPQRRLAQHNTGKASKFTRSHLPVRLVYYEIYKSIGEALRREAAIKRLSRTEKIGLIRSVKQCVRLIP